jgi:hypothetical protein
LGLIDQLEKIGKKLKKNMKKKAALTKKKKDLP